MAVSAIMVNNTTRVSRHAALMSSSHRLQHFLLLSGVASIMPTVTHAFIATHHNCNRNNYQVVTSMKFHRRNVHLPKRNSFQLSSSTSSGEDDDDDDEQPQQQTNNSVTGPIYEMNNSNNTPKIKLFTKEGCTLCDKVKDTLFEIRNDYPHSLYAVDITDEDKQDWFEKYKYDIPVLHMEDVYWTKHRLTKEEAVAALEEVVMEGKFEVRKGEPDAGRLEH